MLDSLRFFQKLDAGSGKRVRLPIEEAWRTFQKLYPKLSISTEARGRLADMLKGLAQQGKIRFPQGKKGWDLGTKPPLPLWVEILREKAQDMKPNMDEIAWPPELMFAAGLKSRSHLDVLLAIREWLAGGGRKAGMVPVKERSAEILGDEKRLDRLLKTDLFAPGALTLDALRCYPVYPDLIWKQGRVDAPALLIIENSNTYHSFCRWNTSAGHYAACVYGNGFMIHHTFHGLRRILAETNPKADIHYFGDLDAAGIRIPTELNKLHQKAGLPAVCASETWYGVMLDQFRDARSRMRRVHPGSWTSEDLAWFSPHLRSRVEEVFQMGYRVPQELVGTGYLLRNSNPI
jgi:hypothetical protein